MLRRLCGSNLVDVEQKAKAMPETIEVGDYFSGTGSFVLVMEAAVRAINKLFRRSTEEEHVAVTRRNCSSQ